MTAAGRLSGRGAQMISSFSIRNFRAFEDVRVDNCRLVNILMGDNGSGKTALLEALFLAAGVTPELILRTFDWRGAPRSQLLGSPEEMHEALWSDLFFKFDTRKHAVVTMRGSGEQNRSVEVRVNSPDSKQVIPPDRTKPLAKPRVVPNPIPIEFRWQIQGSPDVSIKPTFENNSLVFAGGSGKHVKGLIIPFEPQPLMVVVRPTGRR